MNSNVSCDTVKFALFTKFYRTVTFMNSMESENCAHQRKQRVVHATK